MASDHGRYEMIGVAGRFLIYVGKTAAVIANLLSNVETFPLTDP